MCLLVVLLAWGSDLSLLTLIVWGWDGWEGERSLEGAAVSEAEFTSIRESCPGTEKSSQLIQHTTRAYCFLIQVMLLTVQKLESIYFRTDHRHKPLCMSSFKFFFEAFSVEVNSFFLTFPHCFWDCHIFEVLM